MHAHSVPVLLTAPYGQFEFRTQTSRWTMCESVLVPAGIGYEFDMRGDPLSVIYLEPNRAGEGALASLLTDTLETGGALFGKVQHLALLRQLYEHQQSGTWAGDALQDLVQFGEVRARRALDPRIAHALRCIQSRAASNEPAPKIAETLGLSVSRFQHLFTAEVGVPYRRYRAWRRMLLAISEIASGSSFSSAAHGSGHADQSHFAREFRRSFGATPSTGMANVRS